MHLSISSHSWGSPYPYWGFDTYICHTSGDIDGRNFLSQKIFNPLTAVAATWQHGITRKLSVKAGGSRDKQLESHVICHEVILKTELIEVVGYSKNCFVLLLLQVYQ